MPITETDFLQSRMNYTKKAHMIWAFFIWCMNGDLQFAGLGLPIFLLFKGQTKRLFKQLYRKKEDCAKTKSNPNPSLSG